MNKATTIKLSGGQRDELGRRVRSQTIDVRVARRARIVLLAADGVGDDEVKSCFLPTVAVSQCDSPGNNAI